MITPIKTLLQSLIMLACLIALSYAVIVPAVRAVRMIAEAKPSAAPLTEEERKAKEDSRKAELQGWWWYLPGLCLLINFLMAFTHASRSSGGESPALGLATVLGWMFVWIAPYPWWVLLLLALSFPAIEFGTVCLAWFLGEVLSDKPKTNIA